MHGHPHHARSLGHDRMHLRRTRPPAEALVWVERTIGAGARVVGWRRLTGGITSSVHRLTVEHHGHRAPYVLRRWVPDGKNAEYGIGAVASETAALTALERSSIPAPRVIGSTTDAAHAGPAVLMTRVPGRVDLMPRDPERWLQQMAHMLTQIHSLDISAKPFESWLDRSRLSLLPDASRPDIWSEAFALVAEERPPAHTCFIHRDYQHFNLLWLRERLTGVIDWVEASIGPPDVDVGHCRLNLTLLFSADVADRFRQMYEAEAGRKVDPWWDVHALLSFGPEWKRFLPLQIDGRAPLDVDGMTTRMEEVLERTLRRL
ncbi:MAG TPA: aminoglycoside phosphotransferase family protein [Kofleriaceae bacterium]|jgi:aminoglycoside phosphotransferase (APT) family kinase protein